MPRVLLRSALGILPKLNDGGLLTAALSQPRGRDGIYGVGGGNKQLTRVTAISILYGRRAYNQSIDGVIGLHEAKPIVLVPWSNTDRPCPLMV